MIDWSKVSEKVNEYWGFRKIRHAGVDKRIIRSAKNAVARKRAWKNLSDKKLINQKKFIKAQKLVDVGITKFPKKMQLLAMAVDVSRASGDRKKFLEYSGLLEVKYIREAKRLAARKRFVEAKSLVQAALELMPNQLALLKYLAFINCFVGCKESNFSDLERNSLSLNPEDVIAYSYDPDYFKIIQSKREAQYDDGKTNKKYLFVAGLGRSGTTALGGLLNISDSIAMYIELHPAYRINGYSHADFSEKEVSRLSAKRKINYTKMFEKSLNASLVGDKRPSFQFCAESSFDNLGLDNTKCIFVDRSLVDICRSSHKRSVDPQDGWSLIKGVEHAILSYNASCRQIIYLHDHRPEIFSSFLFPRYEDIFSSRESAIKLFDFCGVELSMEEVLGIEAFIESSQKYVGRTFDPSSTLERFIRESIISLLDYDASEHFCRLTGNGRSYM